MSGAHIVENMNTENTNISRTTAWGGGGGRGRAPGGRPCVGGCWLVGVVG